MRRFALVTLIGVSLVVVNPVAQTRTPRTKDGFAVYGPGTVSCGAWTQELNNEMLHNLQLAWVLGFVTGAGMGLATRPVPLRNTDSAGINEFITTYCAQNPLRDISEGAMMLVADLIKP